MKKIKEEWRTAQCIRVDGTVIVFPKYKVSNTGRLVDLDYRRTGKEHELFGSEDDGGYVRVKMYLKGGSNLTCRLHRIVASTFIPCPNPKFEVNHIDENKLNNDVSNLEWLSKHDNIVYGTRAARISKAMTGKFINRKDQSKQVRVTFPDGHQEIFPSTVEADRTLGLPMRTISQRIRKHKGFYRKANLFFEHV